MRYRGVGGRPGHSHVESPVREILALTTVKKRIELISALSLGCLVVAALYTTLVFFLKVPPTESELLLALIKMLTGVFYFAGGAFLLIRKFRIHANFFKGEIRRPGVMATRILLAFLAGATLLVFWGRAYNAIGYRDTDWRTFSASTSGIFHWMVPLWFLHALGEELFFRGFVLGLLKRHTSLLAAILISSALFSIAHMGAAPKSALNFLAGIILALVYLRFDSMIYPVVMHAALNITGQLFTTFSGVFPSLQSTILWAFLAVVLAAGGYDAVARKKPGFFVKA